MAVSRCNHIVTNLKPMTERAVGGLHVHLSKLLVASLGAAIAATVALVVALAIGMPGPPPGPGPQGQPPPPPDLDSLVLFIVITGLVVLTWLAVLVVWSRDQMMFRIGEMSEVAVLRAEIRQLSDRIADYGEQRETDGYLNAMRAVTADGPPEPNVRSIRRTPPQR
jgi:hypothetical protein